jgi:hypothetical protein
MAGYFVESFDNGVGALNHVWGNANIDTSTRGQVTITGYGGFMERPNGEWAGHGYGSYSVVASIQGNSAGPAALLWPGNDQWPGPEYDIVEVINGTPYGTVHYDGGGDRYNSVFFDGINEADVHTYTLDWQPGRITYYVDGNRMGSVTEGVGADYDHGGMNDVIGMMNTNWSTSMTVYEVSYSPSGGGGGSSQTSAPAVVTSSNDQAASGNSGDQSWQSQTNEPWWDEWEAAWDANAGSGDTSWQAEFWADLYA